MTKTTEYPRSLKAPSELFVPEVENDLTRREFLIGAGSLLLVGAVGCENGGGEGGGPSGGTRTIEHELGESEIPANPRRIVALDPLTALPTLLGLGAPVVGAASVFPGGDPFPSFMEGVEGIETVGASAEPNLESIAALDPDLIVGWGYQVEPNYERLSDVAPTIGTNFTFYNGPGWKDDIRAVAELVGGRDQINAEISAYEARAEEVRDAIVEGVRASVIFAQADQLRLHSSCTFLGAVLEEAGLTRPENQRVRECEDDPASGVPAVSLEAIPSIDADAVFYYVGTSGSGNESAEATFDDLLENPLWKSLDAARKGRVFQVSRDVWGLGCDVRAANLVLDDLEEYLLENQ